MKLKLIFLLLSALAEGLLAATHVSRSPANRLTYLDEVDPFHPHREFPKLTTPQWVGEQGVEAVVTFGIDDMRGPERYETFLRPMLERLKKIDGRAPVSIFTNSFNPDHPQAKIWIKEGLSIEVHTLTHPCPLLQQGNFRRATEVVQGGLDLLARIPGNHPVAYRMPCCDSMNSSSPRFFAEIFNRTTSKGNYLQIDSSVFNVFTPRDKSLPRNLVVDPDGKERFGKYLEKINSYAGTIEDYPYPYVINKLCWEFPCTVPSDWEAQNLMGNKNPKMLEDWKRALDATVLKQGVMNFCFHPHGWSSSEQFVDFISYSEEKYGKKVKFLNFKECLDRLNENLLQGNALRDKSGADNGVRILDLNNDGFMDVVVGNETTRRSMVWQPKTKEWQEHKLPFSILTKNSKASEKANFGVLKKDQFATAVLPRPTDEKPEKNPEVEVWHFSDSGWKVNRSSLNAAASLRDVILRDVDGDQACELLTQKQIFKFKAKEGLWEKLTHGFPENLFRNEAMRFIDLNKDGLEDIVYSGPDRWGVYLWTKTPNPGLGWKEGWGYTVRKGERNSPNAIPMISRGGEHPNNGAWFHNDHLWVQNEDTAKLPNVVDRRSFKKLLAFKVAEAKSPEESLKCLKPREGFVAELVAAEPLVLDPVAFDWGADGKLWVAEMGDYPLGLDGKGKPGGVVRFLEDTNNDGRYDKSTVFLSGLKFPTGVMAWSKGVLVSAAPEIIYAEDTNGDGKADLRKVLFSGFREGNQQHRMNGFSLGLDNWIYAANGDSGGTIKSTATGKTVNINGRDFRFKVSGEIETLFNQTQFGLLRDDWGNWFGNNNPNWLWHVHLPLHYVARNPHLVARDTGKMLFNYKDSRRCFPISQRMERPNGPNQYGNVTSANCPSPYRGGLFGEEFENSVFISEPVHNLVHQEVLEPDGVTFNSRRAKGEEDSEFLASTDNWFRPAMTKTGPDGALYVADMYRLVIEHPQWIPPAMQSRVDLREGSDKGRIWRIYPKGSKLRKTPKLQNKSSKDLAGMLDSPNGWLRDTIHRLLLERNDKSSQETLRGMVKKSTNPKVRLQALCILEGLDGLDSNLLENALQDPNPGVREHAVRVCEKDHAELIPSRLQDDSLRVRRQVAFSLGEWKDPKAAQALLEIAEAETKNPRIQLAVKSSALPHSAEMLKQAFQSKRKIPAGLTADLIRFSTIEENLSSLGRVFDEIASDKDPFRQFTLTKAFLDATEQGNKNLEKTRVRLEKVFSRARDIAKDPTADEKTKGSAVALLGRGIRKKKEDLELLSQLLSAGRRPAIRKAALSSIQRLNNSSIPSTLLAGWNSYAPSERLEITDFLLGREESKDLLVNAIKAGGIPANQVSPAHRQRIISGASKEAVQKLKKLLGAIDANREKVIKGYANTGKLSGDATKGKLLFKTHCSTCHKFKGEGNQVGPDLSAFSSKPINEWLIGILDPNRAVETTYAAYLFQQKDGSALTGVISSETTNAIIVGTASGQQSTLLRKNIEKIESLGKSIMPEGLETAVNQQALAHLLAYLRTP